MSLVILCPNCGGRADKIAILSELSRDGQPLFQCPACDLICTAPSLEPMTGVALFPSRELTRQTKKGLRST